MVLDVAGKVIKEDVKTTIFIRIGNLATLKGITMKNVQISFELFVKLLRYHLVDDESCETEIKKELEKKLDAMAKRQIYSQYKTAPTEEEREKARQEYLNKVGILPSFRW